VLLGAGLQIKENEMQITFNGDEKARNTYKVFEGKTRVWRYKLFLSSTEDCVAMGNG
jgi:hypothetical protein